MSEVPQKVMLTEQQQAVADYLKEIGVSYTPVFIPQNASRNAGKKERSINWQVTLSRGDKVISTAYMHVVGHIPNYSQFRRHTLDRSTQEYEASMRGRYFLYSKSGFSPTSFPLPKPIECDIIYCLLSDMSGTDQPFEEWASELGYDTDSRSAEEIYHACVKIGRDMRRLFKSAELAKLQELTQDY